MSIWVLFLLFVGGCVSGLLAGMLGFGGGMLFMLIFANYLTLLKVSNEVLPQLILANSMFAMFICGVSGSLQHYLNKNFYLKPILLIGCTASVCSVFVTHYVIHSKWYNKQVFVIIFIFLVFYMAGKLLFIRAEERQDSLEAGASVNTFFLIGCVGGCLSALAGVGGGIAMIPMLTNLLQIGIRKATAISLGVITISAFATSIYAFWFAPKVLIPHSYGLIVFPMVLPVSLGCMVFSPVGVSMSRKLTADNLRLLYFVFLLFALANMVYNMFWQ